MAKEIKQKIVLEGEKEYNQAIKEAQRNLRTLKSELKAETAELGKNATEQQKAEAKIKSLKKQIAEQEKIVKTYTEALQEVREKYADNQDEIAKWEIKLNNARTALANMKSGLDEVGQGFQNVKGNAETGVVAAHSFAEAFGGLADIGESISGTIEEIFGGVVDAMKAAVGEVWDVITDTAARANNWTDLAKYFGSTAEQVQLLDRAISESAGDFGKFTNLVSQLSFGGKNDKIAEYFGVSDANYKNNMDYTMAVLEAMSNAYNEWGTGGRWDDAMSAIFGGRKSADVSWFVTNLDKIKKKAAELQENGGYLLNEGELETMNEAHVQLATLEDRWDALKSKIATGLFGTLTLDIATDVQGALDALAAYFDADTPEEREAAISDLKKSITDLFSTVADAIRDGIKILEDVSEELKQSNDPIVKGIGNILGGLVDALKWFTEDNAKNVVTALEIIAGFWLTGKGLAMGAKIAEIVGNIRTIQLFNAMSGAGGGADTIIGAGAGDTIAGAGAGGLGAAGMGGILGIVGIGASLFWAADRRKNHPEDVLGTEENLEKSTGGNTTLMDTFAQWVQAQAEWEKIENLTVEATEEEMEALQLKIKDLWEKLDEQEEFSRLWDSYNAWRQESGKSTTDWELPASWWQNGGTDTITGSDLQSFRGLPGQMQQAAKAGVAAGISGLRVTLDGRTVGALVAPYVSEYIGQEMDE